MKTKAQNKNQYDKTRKQTDRWYRVSKNARSLLSVTVRKFIDGDGLKIPNSPALEAVIGAPLSLFLPRLALQANMLGYDLFNDYGVNIELEHLNPITGYAEAAQWNLRNAVKDCFNYKNITVLPIGPNRNHKLKPTVISAIKKATSKSRN
jgi:hypothetical protein